MVLDSLANFIKMNRQVRIEELNPSLVCVICKGYFIDATTIVECVHSFCRSCIVKHFESSKYCPICEVMVHKTKPLLSLKRDKTLQDIVYKLIPGLFSKEMNQRRQFYQDRPHYVKPDDFESGGDVSDDLKSRISDDKIRLTLKYVGSDDTPWYTCCSGSVSIGHLKHMIIHKYGCDVSKVQVEVMLKDQILDSELTLLDIACLFPYRNKESLEFSYVILGVRWQERTEGMKEDEVVICRFTEGDEATSDVKSVVEKEVQLQITEAGVMSVSDMETLLSETVVSSSVPTSTSITLTSSTPARPSISILSSSTIVKKRPSADTREAEQKKVRRLDEKVPRRPSTGPSEVKTKRPSVEDDKKRPANIISENGTRVNRPSVEAKGSKVADQRLVKRPSMEGQEKKANLPLCEGSEKLSNSSGESRERDEKKATVEVKKPAISCGNDVKKPESSNEGSANPQKPLASASQNAASPSSTVKGNGPPSVGQDQKIEESRVDKPDRTATATTASKIPVDAAKPSPVPITRTIVPELNHKGPSSSSSSLPLSEKEPAACSSTSVPIIDKSDKAADQKPAKHKGVRSSPDPWRPVITKEKLRPTLISNSDEAKKPAKFFKNRNAPRFLGNPASGVKPMYSNGMTSMSPPKTPPKKAEPIVRIDPKTLRPMEKEEKKSPSMIMTNPFIPRDNRVVLPDPKTQPFSHFSPGFHASLPPSISLLLNPQQHFRNLKMREEAAISTAAASKHCDTVESKPSASGSKPAAEPLPPPPPPPSASSSEPPSEPGKPQLSS